MYESQGNSFFGKGGRNTKRSQLKYILRLLRSLVATKDERIYMDLCDQGIIPSITGLILFLFSFYCFYFRFCQGHLRNMTQDKSACLDHLDLDILCDGLFILSCLAELDVQRKVKMSSISY